MTTLTKEEARRRQRNPWAKPWQLAKRTRTGIHGQYISDIETRPDGSFSYSEGTVTTYERDFAAVLCELAPGALCIDLMPIDAADQFTRWVFGAPLVTFKPQPRAFDTADITPILGTGLAMSGWGGMLAGALAGSINLDESGPDAYAEYWRSKGARIGHFDGTAIIWED